MFHKWACYFIFLSLLHLPIHSYTNWFHHLFIYYSFMHLFNKSFTNSTNFAVHLYILVLESYYPGYKSKLTLLLVLGELGQETLPLWPSSSLSLIWGVQSLLPGVGVVSVWHGVYGPPKALSKWQLLVLLLSAKHCGQRGVRLVVHWEE